MLVLELAQRSAHKLELTLFYRNRNVYELIVSNFIIP